METILSHLREAVGLGYSEHTIRLGESPTKLGHTKSRPRSPLHSHRTVTVATGRRSLQRRSPSRCQCYTCLALLASFPSQSHSPSCTPPKNNNGSQNIKKIRKATLRAVLNLKKLKVLKISKNSQSHSPSCTPPKINSSS